MVSLGSRFHVARALLLANSPIAITSSRFRDVTDATPQILEDARVVLQAIYCPPPPANAATNTEPTVLLHLRRGDVSETSHVGRYTSAAQLIQNHLDVKRHLKLDRDVSAGIVGAPDSTEAKALQKAGLTLLRSESDLEALEQMRRASVLVTGVSSFSYLAALLSEGTVIYRHFWHPPMDGWLPLNELTRP